MENDKIRVSVTWPAQDIPSRLAILAEMLGDTIETLEKRYTPFVKELRERVRAILESDRGLESALQPDHVKISVTPASHLTQKIQ